MLKHQHQSLKFLFRFGKKSVVGIWTSCWVGWGGKLCVQAGAVSRKNYKMVGRPGCDKAIDLQGAFANVPVRWDARPLRVEAEVEAEVGNTCAGWRFPNDIRLAGCFGELLDSFRLPRAGSGQAILASGLSCHRKGHLEVPRNLLAIVSYGGWTRVAEKNSVPLPLDGERRENVEIKRQCDRSQWSHGKVQLWRTAIHFASRRCPAFRWQLCRWENGQLFKQRACQHPRQLVEQDYRC